MFAEIKYFLRSRLTPAVRVIFVLNVGIFLAQITVMRLPVIGAFLQVPRGDVVPDLLTCDPAAILRHGHVWQLVTYAFIHATPFHLLGNMLFLWFLGPLVEERIGTSAFYRVYFIAVVVAGVSHLLIQALARVPRPMVGASGAVMAIAVVCAVYYFDLLVYFMGFWPIRLGPLITILLAIDAVYLIMPNPGQVANHAHLAGAAVGYLYAKINWRIDWSWADIWRWRWRALTGRLWPFGKRRRPGARIRNIWDDDFFKK